MKVDEPEEEKKSEEAVVEEKEKEKEIESKKTKRKKEKKEKKEKEDNENYEKIGKKTKKTKSKKTKENQEYEETAGISTPSKEVLPSRDLNFDTVTNVPIQLPTSLKELAQDKTVKMLYEIKQLEHDTSKIILIISFINKSENVLKELIFNVLDSPALKLERRVFYFLI